MKVYRTYSSEIKGLIVILVGSLLAFTYAMTPASRRISSVAEGSRDQLQEQIRELKKEREDAILSEKPKTLEQMKGHLYGADQKDLPEEEPNQQESIVDFYNQQLKSEQEAIRKKRKQESQPDLVVIQLTLITAGISLAALGISAFLKSRDPILLEIADGRLQYKPSLFHLAEEIELSQVQSISYAETEHSDTDVDGFYTSYTSHDLICLDAHGKVLFYLDVKKISGVNLSQLKKVITENAPHIEWKFPN